MKKKTFYSEISYLVGIITLALGCALMEKASFGLSMVVAPAYIIYLKLSQYFAFFTFGVTEYIFQAFLLLITMLALRSFKFSYLFSFVTTVIYGYTLNFMMLAVSFLPYSTAFRIVYYLFGMLLCSVGVACFIHTYLSGEVYELIAKEVPEKFHINLIKFKTAYDCISLLAAVLLSFIFFGFGEFKGVGLGTLICSFVNGFLIGKISEFMSEHFEFKDALPLRKYSAKEKERNNERIQG